MHSEPFSDFIRRVREERGLPLRKVAAFLDIDTSTLSKVERGERPFSIEYLQPLSEILGLDPREVQIRFIADRISTELGQLEYITEGLKEATKQINKSRR